jgi:hypothetical protein
MSWPTIDRLPNTGLKRDLQTNLFVQFSPLNLTLIWRISSSGLCLCVDLASTAVSKERIASNFRVEKSASGEPAWTGGCRLVHSSQVFLPWRWRRYVPSKRRLTQDLHSATSQKTTFFIVTAVKASNHTYFDLFYHLNLWSLQQNVPT